MENTGTHVQYKQYFIEIQILRKILIAVTSLLKMASLKTLKITVTPKGDTHCIFTLCITMMNARFDNLYL